MVICTQCGSKMAPNDLSDTPTLAEKHSGIPTRLIDQARRAKGLLFSRRTAGKTISSGGRRVQLPPYTTQEKFNDAIAQLRSVVGDQYVNLNDGTLVDGWYMEHP